MYTDSQEPLKLSSLACMVLLLAALALAGCSAFRPGSIGEAPPAARPAPPVNYTIIFKGVPSRIVKVHLAGRKFLQTLCVGSLKSHNGTERPYQKTYRYTLCGNLTAEGLERELKKELEAFGPRTLVSLADKTFTISVPAMLPIFSPVELRFPGVSVPERTDGECADGEWACGVPLSLTPSELEYGFPIVPECAAGCERPEDIEYEPVLRKVSISSDPYLGVEVPKGVISNINPVSRLCRGLDSKRVVSYYPPKFVQVEREDRVDHIDVCWCRTKHPDYLHSKKSSYPNECNDSLGKVTSSFSCNGGDCTGTSHRGSTISPYYNGGKTPYFMYR